MRRIVVPQEFDAVAEVTVGGAQDPEQQYRVLAYIIQFGIRISKSGLTKVCSRRYP